MWKYSETEEEQQNKTAPLADTSQKATEYNKLFIF